MTTTASETPAVAGRTPDQLRAQLMRRELLATVRGEVAGTKAERKAKATQDRIRRRATLAGEIATTRHDIYQSGEARAQRVASTQTIALVVLLPVLVAFGAWSAAGVQAGLVTLLSIPEGSPLAAAAWLLEPALIGGVAGIIILRARLRSAGGDLDHRATRVELGALGASIVLNAVGHWPSTMDLTAAGALLGHTLGPVGAAATAYLISVVQDGVSSADPWTLPSGERAPSLRTQETPETAAQELPEGSPESAPALSPAVLLLAARAALAASPAPTTDAPRGERTSAPEQPQKPARESRPDQGKRVPPAARKTSEKPSPRRMTDAQLADALAALVDSQDLPESPAVSRVQDALSLGFERAKRVLAIHHERTEAVLPGQLDITAEMTAQESPEAASVAV